MEGKKRSFLEGIKKDLSKKPRWVRCQVAGVLLAALLVSLYNCFFVVIPLLKDGIEINGG